MVWPRLTILPAWVREAYLNDRRKSSRCPACGGSWVLKFDPLEDRPYQECEMCGFERPVDTRPRPW
jgi:predicted Zn-ribbon and HTH transcriptional regulator